MTYAHTIYMHVFSCGRRMRRTLVDFRSYRPSYYYQRDPPPHLYNRFPTIPNVPVPRGLVCRKKVEISRGGANGLQFFCPFEDGLVKFSTESGGPYPSRPPRPRSCSSLRAD